LITAAHHGDPPVGVSEAPHRRNQRLEHILSLLQREDLPARGLLDRLRRARIPCSRRMLQLDLDLLRQRLGPDQLQRITRQQVEHMPRGCAAERIFFRLRTGGVHRVTPTGNLVLGDDELVALHLARRLVRGSGTGIHPLADALDRVLASLGIPTADPQDTPAPWEPVQVSSCGAMPYAAVHLTTLLRAIRNDCALAVSYKRIGAHDVEEFQALPARLVLIDGVWYCASWVPQNNRLRLLAVARIQSADLIATRITRPSDLTSQVDGAIHLAFRGHVDDTSVRIELAVDNFAWDAVAHQTWGAPPAAWTPSHHGSCSSPDTWRSSRRPGCGASSPAKLNPPRTSISRTRSPSPRIPLARRITRQPSMPSYPRQRPRMPSGLLGYRSPTYSETHPPVASGDGDRHVPATLYPGRDRTTKHEHIEHARG
jgi:predicted DNA-binding transcriptional regulator YafY